MDQNSNTIDKQSELIHDLCVENHVLADRMLDLKSQVEDYQCSQVATELILETIRADYYKLLAATNHFLNMKTGSDMMRPPATVIKELIENMEKYVASRETYTCKDQPYHQIFRL